MAFSSGGFSEVRNENALRLLRRKPSGRNYLATMALRVRKLERPPADRRKANAGAAGTGARAGRRTSKDWPRKADRRPANHLHFDGRLHARPSPAKPRRIARRLRRLRTRRSSRPRTGDRTVKTFSARLTKFRDSRRWPNAALAEYLSDQTRHPISTRTVEDWIQGKRRPHPIWRNTIEAAITA